MVRDFARRRWISFARSNGPEVSTQMAKKTPSPSKERNQTELTTSIAEAEKQLTDRIARGRDILSPRPSTSDALEQARSKYHTWDEYNTALLGKIFSTAELSQEYSYWGIAVISGRTDFEQDVREFVDDVNQKIRRLESIRERIPLYDRSSAGPVSVPPSKRAAVESSKVFVVHGRNNELKETVARFLAQLDLQPIILHEQPSAGRTIIEKFEENSDACFAVVLLTPDDLGCLALEKSDKLKSRARQNVIFEWGFFVASLGRRKACALVAEGLEIPSDMDGIVYIPLDQAGAWKMLLVREMKAGGVDIDANRAI